MAIQKPKRDNSQKCGYKPIITQKRRLNIFSPNKQTCAKLFLSHPSHKLLLCADFNRHCESGDVAIQKQKRNNSQKWAYKSIIATFSSAPYVANGAETKEPEGLSVHEGNFNNYFKSTTSLSTLHSPNFTKNFFEKFFKRVLTKAVCCVMLNLLSKSAAKLGTNKPPYEKTKKFREEKLSMKKILTAFLVCAVMVLCFGAFACTPPQLEKEYTVTWYDATGTSKVSEMTVLKTEKVKEGETLTSYTPTKDGGYEFVDWFAVPSKNHRFDFTTKIKEDTSVYAGFTLYTEDTRSYYVVGSGTSELLFSSDWGKVINDSFKLKKAADKNEYTITMDLKKDDEFQFAINSSWQNQRGFGYLLETKLADGTEVFTSNASPYTDAAKTANIKVEHAGNYTFTLKTYPNEDYYNTEAPTYTEENKETYNMGTYDSITWVRNGDVLNDSVTVTDLYIKGAGITGWADMYNNATKMSQSGSNYTLSVYLKEGEEFLFTSTNTVIENGESTTSVGSIYVKAGNLDEASKAFVGGEAGNMTAKASGNYTFTYNKDTQKLTVTYESAEMAANDYYIDGNFNGGNYGDFINTPANFILTEKEGSGIYMIESVTLNEGAELLLRGFNKGETPNWTATRTDYQYNYLRKNPAFSAASATNNNIKVLTAGVYDISFDSYSKIITITEHTDSADTLDIYIKGSGINSWAHNFDAQWKFGISEDGKTYEYTLTVTADTAVEFGMERHPKGETTGYGDYLGASVIGTSGDANALFTPASGSNFKCSTAGTYKIVYDIESGKVDFYKVNA